MVGNIKKQLEYLFYKTSVSVFLSWYFLRIGCNEFFESLPYGELLWLEESDRAGFFEENFHWHPNEHLYPNLGLKYDIPSL